MYTITPLKRDPKDFSLRETMCEIARSRSLASLYDTAKTLIPELEISNDSLAYYAALVDYCTVNKAATVFNQPCFRPYKQVMSAKLRDGWIG